MARTPPLHALNPVRLEYVAARAALSQRRVLDIGCGGGLLSEGLARHGAHVTGIDMAPSMIEVARLHAQESQITLDYELDYELTSATTHTEQRVRHRTGRPWDVQAVRPAPGTGVNRL